jgi:hypothetical protein
LEQRAMSIVSNANCPLNKNNICIRWNIKVPDVCPICSSKMENIIPILHELENIPSKNKYFEIQIDNDIFVANAVDDVNKIKQSNNTNGTINKSFNFVTWDTNDDYFTLSSTKLPVLLEKDKIIFQYKDAYIVLLLANLELIPNPTPKFEFVQRMQRIEKTPTTIAIAVKNGQFIGQLIKEQLCTIEDEDLQYSRNIKILDSLA